MTTKRHYLISRLRKSLSTDTFWTRHLAPANEHNFSLHLAIMQEPYLGYLMTRRKTVETRFAKRRCPPFEAVKDGDVLLLKRVGGDVVGVCWVQKVWFYQLDPASLAFIRERFGEAICPADDAFWMDRAHAAYATLMQVAHVQPVERIPIDKRDRRGWVVVEDPKQKMLLE